MYAFSALTLLVGWQEGHPACKKTEWWGAGVVICLERGADLHTAQLMPLEKGPLNGRARACVLCRCVCCLQTAWWSVICLTVRRPTTLYTTLSWGTTFPTSAQWRSSILISSSTISPLNVGKGYLTVALLLPYVNVEMHVHAQLITNSVISELIILFLCFLAG